MKRNLLILSFLEGATVMVAEICGARLLAPVFGSSLYVWASVMGITLFALAGGYFWGGRLSEHPDRAGRTLFRILSLASLSVLLMPLLSELVLPTIAALPFRLAVVFSSLLVLLPPVIFLGAASPLFIALQASEQHGAGKVSGVVYATSTLGGILATFFSGFYLIPELGLKCTLLIFGSLLLISTFLLLRRIDWYALLLLIGSVGLFAVSKQPYSGLLFESEGVMGTISVHNQKRDGQAIRLLRVNHIIQSEMNIQSGRSVSAYVEVIDSLSHGLKPGKRALVLGLGAGLTSNLFVSKGAEVDAVEFDPRVYYVAKHYFGLFPQVHCSLEDARQFINCCNTKYDLILVDVFKAEEQPSHVITIESLSKMKKMMVPEASLVINWHGYVSSPLGMGTSVLVNTLKSSGFNVKCCSTGSEENYRNLLIVASMTELKNLPFELNETIPETTQLNSDDQPVFERANAEANRHWRALYLKASR